MIHANAIIQMLLCYIVLVHLSLLIVFASLRGLCFRGNATTATADDPCSGCHQVGLIIVRMHLP